MTERITPLLEVRHVTKVFPGVVALDDVSFSVLPGEVHAVAGENGAGKSTLMKIIMGQYKATSGEVWFDGKPANFEKPAQALDAGLSMIYQEISALTNLTVAQNIFLGREPLTPLGLIDHKKQITDTREIIKKFNFAIDPTTRLSELSIAQMQVIEIIKAVSMDSKLIVMDEPTSSLSSDESQELFKTIGMLKAQGVAIIYISHRMEEIFNLADRVTVFRDGKLIGTHLVSEVTPSSLVTMMVGREINNLFPKEEVEPGEVIFEAKNLTSDGVFRNISFSVRKGEILGLAGLVGAGRTEIVRTIFGLDPLSSGEMFMDGEKLRIKNCGDAIRHGIAMVSEDRKSVGLVLCRSLLENIALPNLHQFSKGQLLNHKTERKACEEISKTLRTKCSSIDQRAESLSGGNQQKVVISKWLLTNPRLMILDEPTRGIDVGAKAEIHALISKLAKEGMAVIMISSEMPEILGMSDRILVIGDGEIRGEFDCKSGMPKEILQEKILECEVGGNHE